GYRWFYYNNQGLLTIVSNAFGIAQKTVFDIEDNPMWGTDANNFTVTNTYDLIHRMLTRTYPDSGMEKFGYSARGLTAYTNQIGTGTNFYAYDEGGRKTFETNANAQLIQYRWDSAGNLTNLIDGKSQSTRWNYDAYSRVTNSWTRPVWKSCLKNSGNSVLDSYAYIYDPANERTNLTRADGSTVAYRYDNIGQLTVG